MYLSTIAVTGALSQVRVGKEAYSGLIPPLMC
jgi:hypothetical protein